MLVISRRVGEVFFIGEAEVKILSKKDGIIRIGIAAPKEIPIVRGNAKKREPIQSPSRKTRIVKR